MKLTILLPYQKKPEHLRLLELLISENARSSDPLELTVVAGFELTLAGDYDKKVITLTEKEPFSSRMKASMGGTRGFRYDYIDAVKRELSGDDCGELLIFDCIELAEPIGKALRKNPFLLMRGDFFESEHPCARMAYHIIKRVILPSSELIKLGEREYLPASRCTVLHDAIDDRIFASARERKAELRAKIREKYGISPDARVFVMTDTPDTASGAVELVKAIDSLSGSTARLMLCAEPDAEYAEQLKNAASGSTLIFAKHESTPELAELVASADVAAVPSLGCGGTLSALEAIALGLPLVVSNSPTLREHTSGYLLCSEARRGLGYVNAIEEAIAELDEKCSSESANAGEMRSSEAWYGELRGILFE